MLSRGEGEKGHVSHLNQSFTLRCGGAFIPILLPSPPHVPPLLHLFFALSFAFCSEAPRSDTCFTFDFFHSRLVPQINLDTSKNIEIPHNFDPKAQINLCCWCSGATEFNYLSTVAGLQCGCVCVFGSRDESYLGVNLSVNQKQARDVHRGKKHTAIPQMICVLWLLLLKQPVIIYLDLIA